MFKWVKRLSLVCFAIGILGLASIVAIYFHVKSDLPDVETIKTIKLQVPMKVYSLDGELISQFGTKKRIPLTRDQVPDQLINAFLATEDTRFYNHYGIDPIGIVRAATVYISTGRAKQGASTITQQVARNFFLTNEKTFIRKIKEIFIAIELEQILTKEEILMLYLNKISLGHRSYGVGAAAQTYYGKDVMDLTLAEMAVLAGLPKAPSRLNPLYSPTNALARRDLVLGRMLIQKNITQAEYDEAINTPNTAKYHQTKITLSAHYVAEMARNKLFELYGEESAYSDGFNVYTTITKKYQEAANKALIDNLHSYDERHGYKGSKKSLFSEPSSLVELKDISDYLKTQPSFADLQPAIVTQVLDQEITIISKSDPTTFQTITWDGLKWARPYISDTKQGTEPTNASEIVSIGDRIWVREVDGLLKLSQFPQASSAFVSVNPNDGAITSLVGGFSFVQSKFNRATQAKRQVGSNIKPFIYSAALDSGYTLATLINDAPINEWSGSVAWRPKNSPPVYEGPIRLRRGLGQSKNVISVRLMQSVGARKVVNQLGKFGFIKSELPRNLTLALGSASLTPLEVATGYATISNGGFKIEPYIIERIENAYGDVVYQAAPKIVCAGCSELFVEQETMEVPLEHDLTSSYTFGQFCPISPVHRDQIAQPAISPENAFLTKELLNTAILGGGSWRHQTGWNGTGWRATKAIKRKDMGGKTGTSNDSRDTWFSGYVGEIVATSWVGFDDFNKQLGKASFNKNLDKTQIKGSEFGGRTAQPAWISFMTNVALDQPVKKKVIPKKIVTVRIDRKTGLLTKRTDHTSIFEYFRTDSVPTEYVKDQAALPSFDEAQAESSKNDEEIF